MRPSRDGVDSWTPALSWPMRNAGCRYKRRVRKIVRLLRAEVKREIRRVEREVHDGESLSSVLLSHNPRLSPLGLYISALRFGRPDLASVFNREPPGSTRGAHSIAGPVSRYRC